MSDPSKILKEILADTPVGAVSANESLNNIPNTHAGVGNLPINLPGNNQPVPPQSQPKTALDALALLTKKG